MAEDLPDDFESAYPCPHCAMGTLQPQWVTFAHWFEGQFITLPNFPAWVCDVCGVREYDAAALEQLELILGPEADLRRAAGQAARRAGRNVPPPALHTPRRARRRS